MIRDVDIEGTVKKKPIYFSHTISDFWLIKKFPGKMKKVKLNCHFGICTAVDPKIWDTCNYVCNAELGKHTAC